MLFKKKQTTEEMTPASQEAEKKQRSLNRVFGLIVVIAVLLFAMLVYELVLLGIK